MFGVMLAASFRVESYRIPSRMYRVFSIAAHVCSTVERRYKYANIDIGFAEQWNISSGCDCAIRKL